jgi:hypothetical protein
LKHAGTLNFVASFFSVFSDWISLKVPNRTAYYYKRAYRNRFKSRHSAQFPKFPGKGITFLSRAEKINTALVSTKN